MFFETREYILSCDNCQRNKIQRQLPSGRMFSIEAFSPIDLVAFDTIGPLPISVNNKKHALVGKDVFSKFVMLSALSDIQGNTIATEIKKMFAFIGIPKALLTDNAPSFVNKDMRDLQFQMKFEHKLSTARHHRGNSVSERAIQSVEQRLLTLTHDAAFSINWDEELNNVMMSINTSYHATTGFTPYKILFGFEADQPSELIEFQNEPAKFVQLRDASQQRDHITTLESTLDAQTTSKNTLINNIKNVFMSILQPFFRPFWLFKFFYVY